MESSREAQRLLDDVWLQIVTGSDSIANHGEWRGARKGGLEDVAAVLKSKTKRNLCRNK